MTASLSDFEGKQKGTCNYGKIIFWYKGFDILLSDLSLKADTQRKPPAIPYCRLS